MWCCGARSANTTASLRVRFAFPQFASLGGVEWYGTLSSLWNEHSTVDVALACRLPELQYTVQGAVHQTTVQYTQTCSIPQTSMVMTDVISTDVNG